MADSKQPIIIKKITVAGHGAHGGAWKVAYADFVTAMMAFFMVMWLMGSDEETKADIAHYFNHPNTPYKNGKDPGASSAHPLGEKVGEGDSILKGLNGGNPDDLVPDPTRAIKQTENFREVSQQVTEVIGDKAFGVEVDLEHLKFSISEENLFEPGTTTLREKAGEYLDRVGRILMGFKGQVNIEDHSDELEINGHKASSLYEASVLKSVAVMNYLVEHNWVSEDRLHPVVTQNNKDKFTQDTSPESDKKNRRVEFVLQKAK